MADLPTRIQPATVGQAATGHAGDLRYHTTLCDRPVNTWLSGGRGAIACRTCLAQLDRRRWSPDDYAPAVTADELERMGFLT